jgi:hypothetical protein
LLKPATLAVEPVVINGAAAEGDLTLVVVRVDLALDRATGSAVFIARQQRGDNGGCDGGGGSDHGNQEFEFLVWRSFPGSPLDTGPLLMG